MMSGRKKIAEQAVIYQEAVKLMSVDRQVTNALIIPFVFLIDLDPHQMRHDLRKAIVMIAFDPNHFDLAFGI
jgi:hypothetical protein